MQQKLLYHLVGTQQKGFGDGEADGLGGLEIDDKLDPCRQLDREIGGLCAFEYLVDVIAGAAEQVRVVRAVRQKASACDVASAAVYSREARSQRQRVDSNLV